MRSLLLVIMAVLAIGCSNTDPAPVYIDLDYQVRCLDCEPRSPDDPKRVFALLDGDLGEEPDSFYELRCHANTVGKHRVLTFSAKYTSPTNDSKDHSFKVAQVEFEGDDPGSNCNVEIREGSNHYKGKCGGDAPLSTADVPCQIALAVENGILNGTLRCVDLPNESLKTSTRHIVRSDRADPMADDDKPATFEFDGCTGL